MSDKNKTKESSEAQSMPKDILDLSALAEAIEESWSEQVLKLVNSFAG